ncbi:MAG: aminotransferase class V-fold PLP-dependent enzyme [Lachnospiraceae bacterium]|nr:aminotransferase class V-fold PLP-dependent enzyme [Lachnospiraceae bacterium]
MLAIFGGEPVKKTEFMSWPVTKELDKELLLETIRSGKWSNGSKKAEFEARFAADCDVKHVFAVANGTVSLELILRGLGIGYGDEVILPPYTFVATLSSIVFAGATPVFADIDRGTYDISPASVEEKITPNTKAIVAVAIGGCPPDLDALTEIAQKYNVKLIVDAAQGVGAIWNGKSICAYGDAASISCQNSKNLTSGEGGIITTNHDELAAAIAQMLRGGYVEDENGERVYTTVGQDQNISEFQASLLLSQYDKLYAEMAVREKNAAYLAGRMKPMEFAHAMNYDDRIDRHAYHLFVIRLDSEKFAEKGITREQFIKALNAEGIPLSVGYNPLYTFPCITVPYTEELIGTKITVENLPESELAAYKEGTWLYQACLLGTREDMDMIADAMIKVWEHADEIKGL